MARKQIDEKTTSSISPITRPMATDKIKAGLGRRFTLARTVELSEVSVPNQFATALMMFSCSLAYFKTGKLMT